MSIDPDPERQREVEIATLPEPLREAVTHWFAEFDQRHDGPIAPEVLPRLVRLVAVSEFAARVLLSDWPEMLREGLPPTDSDADALDRFVAEVKAGGIPTERLKPAFRCFRRRYLTRVLWREVATSTDVESSLYALSALADRLLDAAAACAERTLIERFGRVMDAQGRPVPLIVLGMGKLGGFELNFSSDIDLVFLYPRDGVSDGRKSLSAPEYFTRMAQQVVALLDEVTADGFVFRVDLRLRPFGDSGPSVVSFAALEGYLLNHGRDWERYAWVKARIVGPQPPDRDAHELFQNLIHPFVYRRYLDYGVFESLRDMHATIAAEVRRRDLVDSVKLGPGGIREIEFIVQSLQLVRGGSQPELVEPSLLKVLPELIDARGLDAEAVAELARAYRFLRRLENFIQGLRDRQTHDLPGDAVDRARLAFAMGFDDWQALQAGLDSHRAKVTRHFEAIAFRDTGTDGDDALHERIVVAWDARSTAAEWQALLDAEAFAGSARIASILIDFQASPSTRKVDGATARRLRNFVARLLLTARAASDPAAAVERCLGVTAGILRRSAYIALLNENPLATRRLVRLCESSTYIAEQLRRFPVLLDELLDPAADTRALTREALGAELEQRLSNIDRGDTEAQTEALAQFQRSILFRIAVADFTADLPIMKVSDSLTYLAEVVVEKALHLAWRDLAARHGEPHYLIDGRRQSAGFAVIAYGKLGGLELSYGSDLDLVFLHDSAGDSQQSDGDRPLENSVFFARLVRRIVHILTTRTSSGVLYEVDTRLRPSGRSGLLVTSAKAFERYQEENAWTWEHQALLRARPIAGSERLAEEFQRIRADTLKYRVRRDGLEREVVSMRQRMRRELDQSNATRFDLKQGPGGIADIEFLVQYLLLKHARQASSVFLYTDNIRQLDALADERIVERAEAHELQAVYRRFRHRLHRLALNDQPPLVDAGAFNEARVFVTRKWETYLAGPDA